MTVQAPLPGLHDITREVVAWACGYGVTTGLLTLFLHHTSASLIIQENADPDMLHERQAFFARLAPEDARLYRHTTEGPDDLPTHIKTALTQVSLSVPVSDWRPALGTWQGICLFEHRIRPTPLRVTLHLTGV